MFAATGSTITAAIAPALASNSARTAARSLYGATSVSAAAAAGTPGLSGRLSVAWPDPACTSSPSAWPWYPPSNLMILERPVKARASRSADIVASVPELTNRTSSIEGTASTMRPASSTSSSLVAPKAVPRNAASPSTATTAGGACPRISGP